MRNTGASLPVVAAFSLIVPLLATPAVAAPVPQLPVRPQLALAAPEDQAPWLAAGITFAPSAAEPDYELYGLEQDGSDKLTATEDPVVSRPSQGEVPLSSVQPTFSPDGSQVVFSAQLDRENPDDPDPGWMLVTGDVAAAGPTAVPAVTNVAPVAYTHPAGTADSQPAWSPDGQYLAFVREYPDPGPRAIDGPQVQILDLADGTRTEVSVPPDDNEPEPNYHWSMSPSWSPDSSALILIGSVGTSTGSAFAPAAPDIAGTGSLWYYDLDTRGVHQVTVSEPGCDDVDVFCDVAINANTAAWSPESNQVAYTPPFSGGVELLTLPDTLPGAGSAHLTVTESGTALMDGEPPSLRSLAWNPDGSALYAATPVYADLYRFDLDAGTSGVVYPDPEAPEDVGILGLAYQPWSDLGITLEPLNSTVVGTSSTLTAEVTNAGPSPSRTVHVQVEIPAGVTVDTPAGCTDPVDRVLNCELDGLPPGESAQLEIPITATAPTDGTVYAVVTSDSPDPGGANAAPNQAITSLLAADDPTPAGDARSTRISFTMDRISPAVPGQPWSDDLAQSLTVPPTDASPADYRVLADATYNRIEPPEGDPVPGPFVPDENNLDYSRDGSQAVYDRWARAQDYFGENETSNWHRLVLADVVGTQQSDLGEPGELINAEEINSGTDSEFEDAYSDTEAVFSPDGTQIAFVRSPGGEEPGSRLRLYDVATGEVSAPIVADWRPPTSQARYRVSSPSWSPDGTGLIFVADGGNADPTLWYVDLVTGQPHELELPDPAAVCWPVEPASGQEPCSGPVYADSAAWAPNDNEVAITNPLGDDDQFFLVTVPQILDRVAADLDADETITITDLQLVDALPDTNPDYVSAVIDPTWSPDGSSIAVGTNLRQYEDPPSTAEAIVEITPAEDPADQTSTPMYTAYPGIAVDQPEYEPYSDLSVSIEHQGQIPVGSPTPVTVTVSNLGPSPARDATVTIPLPSGVTAGDLPTECTAGSAAITCELTGPVTDGTAWELPLIFADGGDYSLSATGVTNSIDPQAGNDQATSTLTAAAAVADSERIAFSMDRTPDPVPDGEITHSLDLVQSEATEPGDGAADDYQVLASGVLDAIENPFGEQQAGGPFLTTDDNIDYSPDGSRAAFNRTGDRQYEYTDDQRLVLADVVGMHQPDLGEPGELINLTEIPDQPGALATDSGEFDRVSDSEPVWSPDGSQLAFVRMLATNDSDTPGQIMLLDPDSNEMTSPIDPDWLAGAGAEFHMGSPTWTADGNALVFDDADDFSSNPATLWYLPLSTGVPHQLMLPADGSVCWPDFEDFCTGPINGWQPAASPDGDQVAFEYYTSGGIGVTALTLPADAATVAAALPPGDPLPIAALIALAPFSPPGPEALPATSPAWSPGGDRIAAAVGSSDYIDHIGALTLATDELTTMFQAEDIPTDLFHPEFAPVSDVAVGIAHAPDVPLGTITPLTLTVTNNGPSPARDAILQVRLPAGVTAGTLPEECTATGATLTCTVAGPIPVGAEVPVKIPVTFANPGGYAITATVTTNSIDTEAGNDEATSTFTVAASNPPDNPDSPDTPDAPDTPATPDTTQAADLRLRVTLDAGRAWLGGDGLATHVTISNHGPNPARNVQLSTAVGEDVLILEAGDCPLEGACDLGTIAAGANVSVDLLLQPTAVGQAEFEASATTSTADPKPGNNTDTATFEAVQAQLRLLPSVAVPGEVSLLYGVDLPPDAEITMRWSEGVTTTYRPVAAAPDGTLRSSVLIVNGDELGERTLEITSVGGTAFGLETPPTMLVVPRSMQAPDFLGRT